MCFRAEFTPKVHLVKGDGVEWDGRLASLMLICGGSKRDANMCFNGAAAGREQPCWVCIWNCRVEWVIRTRTCLFVALGDNNNDSLLSCACCVLWLAWIFLFFLALFSFHFSGWSHAKWEPKLFIKITLHGLLGYDDSNQKSIKHVVE